MVVLNVSVIFNRNKQSQCRSEDNRLQFIPNATLLVSKILESIIIKILPYLLLLVCADNKILLF